jgi:ribosomal protein S18 acetylase RimI-like enzyme
LWLTGLTAALTCREIHFAGTSVGVYVALGGLLLIAWLKAPVLEEYFASRRTVTLLAAGFFCYFLAKSLDQHWWKAVPGEPTFERPVEETMEVLGHVLILAVAVTAAKVAPGPVVVRRYAPGEEPDLWRLYHDTTHLVNGRDYTAEQCARWAPAEKDMDEWARRIGERNPFVAERDGVILGFAELEADGHIDCFYVHHAHQREGVGRALHDAVEAEARRLGLDHLRAEVSVTARAFFEAMGFEIVHRRENVVCGAVAPNFVMRKSL